MLIGDTMFINFSFEQTSVEGDPGIGLNFRIPAGYVSATESNGTYTYWDGSPASATGSWAATQFGGGQDFIQLRKAPAMKWSVSTNGHYLFGLVILEVQRPRSDRKRY